MNLCKKYPRATEIVKPLNSVSTNYRLCLLQFDLLFRFLSNSMGYRFFEPIKDGSLLVGSWTAKLLNQWTSIIRKLSLKYILLASRWQIALVSQSISLLLQLL